MMLNLLFPRRHFAIQIVEKFESDIRSKAATQLIEMIIWGSKNLSQRDNFKTIDSVIFGADGIVHNKTAAERLKRELQLSDTELVELRYRLNMAVLDFAMDNGRLDAFSVITKRNQLLNQPKET
jgi:hypothetical protein